MPIVVPRTLHISNKYLNGRAINDNNLRLLSSLSNISFFNQFYFANCSRDIQLVGAGPGDTQSTCSILLLACWMKMVWNAEWTHVSAIVVANVVRSRFMIGEMKKKAFEAMCPYIIDECVNVLDVRAHVWRTYVCKYEMMNGGGDIVATIDWMPCNDFLLEVSHAAFFHGPNTHIAPTWQVMYSHCMRVSLHVYASIDIPVMHNRT